MKLFGWFSQWLHHREPELQSKFNRADELAAEIDVLAADRRKTMREIITSLGRECELDNEFKDLFRSHRGTDE